MAQIATVAAITGTGTAFAVNEQGVSRQLKAGDVLQKGETIRTVGDVRVELLMEDGRLLAVAPGQVLRLDENVTESDQRPTAQDSAVTTPGATAEAVIQALERGTDLSTELEATAAGLGGGSGADGGVSFVQLLRITEGVEPQAFNYSFEAQPELVDLQPDPPLDSPAVTATITIDTIAGDNVINISESEQLTTTVSGTVGGDVKVGDVVTLLVNGNTYTGVVSADANGVLVYSIPVVTTDLMADNTIDASVTTSNATGTASATATTDTSVTVDLNIAASITIDTIAGDDIINATEAKVTDTAVSGTVGGDVKLGDVVTLLVNGNTYTGLVTAGAGGTLVYSIDVKTADLMADNTIDASVTATVTANDPAGNSVTATATHDVTVESVNVTTLVVEGPDATVSEHGLVATDGSQTTSGTFTVTTSNGIANIVVGGTPVTAAELNALSTTNKVISTGEGTLTLTNYNSSTGAVSYTYTLDATIDNDSKVPATGDAVTLTDFTDNVSLVVNGIGGTTASDTLSIRVVDDTPTAVNDTDSIASGSYAAATGNVITDAEGDGGQDVVGADSAKITLIASNNVPANTDSTADGSHNFVVNGQYGQLTINEDGTYSYVRTAGTAGGVDDVFTYTLTDGDTDARTATLTISIGDNTPTLNTLVQPTDVEEAGLPTRTINSIVEPAGSGEIADGNGADNDVSSETTSGSFTFTVGDGPATAYINGVAVSGTVGQTFAGTYGTLTITGTTATSVSYSYTLTDNTSGNTTHDDFSVVVKDVDLDATAAQIIRIDIVDDVPSISAPNAVMLNSSVDQTLVAPLAVVYGADGKALSGALTLSGIAFSGDTSTTVIQGTYTVNNVTTTINLTYNNGETLHFVKNGDSTLWTAVSDTTSTTVFTISVNSTDGTYTVTLLEKLDPVLDTASFRSSDIVSAGINTVLVYNDTPTSLAMKLTADTAATTGGNVDKINTTNEWIGVGNQSIGASDALIMSFGQLGYWDAAGAVVSGSGKTPSSINQISLATNALYSGETLEFTSFDASGNVVTGATWTVLRYGSFTVNLDGTVTPVGTPTVVTVTSGTGIISLDGVNHNGWSVGGADGATGADHNDYYVLTSNVSFSTIVFEGGASTTFDIGYIDVKVVKDAYDITTTFGVTATDGDTDPAADNTVSLTFSTNSSLDGTANDSNVIQGGDGIQTLTGGNLNDTLIGGAGNDTLTGGAGADVFKWSLGDQGTTTTPAVDRIIDFDVTVNGPTASTSPSTGDTLDLRDLLNLPVNGSENDADLTNYLKFELIGGKLALAVDHDGGTFEATQKIVLDNYSGSTVDAAKSAFGLALGMGTGTFSDADIINKMIADGHLKTDI